ncbi:MAG: phosphoribosylformylglycinamidine cyclo-ligase [Chloroflexaceae bacterium]|nr:phosphoribosylformylglycinamidine cyclo-ligase [Chloroflexaceae bacterium]
MTKQLDAYARAGVNIAAGQEAVRLMRDAVRSTHGAEVLSDVGAFGGLYSLAAVQQMQEPVLVATTDGVGTKTMVAAQLQRWDTLGQDLVNHCINDLLVQGAHPLFFLDYIAAPVLQPEVVAALVKGMAVACRTAQCALLGGETAEMPDIYAPDQLDLVGTMVGVVERSMIIDGSRIQAGDMLLGLPSTGLHTNGYTLARHVLAELDWTEPYRILGDTTLAEALLAVHRSYLDPVQKLLRAGIDIHGMAHITGGGVVDNLPRILPNGVQAIIRRGTWREPPIFGLIQQRGQLSQHELFHTFNMGLGMILVVPPGHATRALATLTVDLSVVGEVVKGNAGVIIA